MIQKTKLISILLLLFHCSSTSQRIENPELGKEYISANEDEISKKTFELTLNSIKEKAVENNTIVKRDAHPKHHGCVAAKFTVLENIPAELKAGIFAKPASYDTWIRFSSGSTTPQRDDIGDIRGAGLKLLGVKGDKVLEKQKKATTQDFLLINHTVLPVGDPQEYLDLFEASFQKKVFGYFFGWNPFAWKLGALGKVRAIRGKKIPNMLHIRYWSTTPYRLGENLAVKYSMKPCGGEKKDMPDTTEENYLRRELSKSLESGEACFDFMVQKQIEPKEFPIEDPSYEWNEEVSPFLKVAEVKIPAQKFDSEKQMNYCENLSFNPWHSLPENKPIGGINRVRKFVYEGISTYRHETNKVPEKEPEKLEVFK